MVFLRAPVETGPEEAAPGAGECATEMWVASQFETEQVHVEEARKEIKQLFNLLAGYHVGFDLGRHPHLRGGFPGTWGTLLGTGLHLLCNLLVSYHVSLYTVNSFVSFSYR